MVGARDARLAEEGVVAGPIRDIYRTLELNGILRKFTSCCLEKSPVRSLARKSSVTEAPLTVVSSCRNRTHRSKQEQCGELRTRFGGERSGRSFFSLGWESKGERFVCRAWKRLIKESVEQENKGKWEREQD